MGVVGFGSDPWERCERWCEPLDAEWCAAIGGGLGGADRWGGICEMERAGNGKMGGNFRGFWWEIFFEQILVGDGTLVFGPRERAASLRGWVRSFEQKFGHRRGFVQPSFNSS